MRFSTLSGTQILINALQLFIVAPIRHSREVSLNTFNACFGTHGLITFQKNLLLALSACFFLTTAIGQNADNTYYVPVPETELHATLKTFTTTINRSIGNDIRSTISIVPTEDTVVIFYDHWEDGYEADITNPVQSSTEVWGDGNVGNMILNLIYAYSNQPASITLTNQRR